MLNTKLRDRAMADEGFTLVELLVVILIIGILAAIAIPSYISQRTKAQDADAIAYVQSAAASAEACATDNQGAYGACTVAALQTLEPTLNNATNLVAGVLGAGFIYSADAPGGGTRTFTMTRAAGGAITRTCDTPSTGKCTAGSTW